jgi:hypothetical protein
MAGREFEDLTIEPRGDGYVIIRVDGAGVTTELLLSEAVALALARIAPPTARRILASKSPAGSDILASVAAPAKNFELVPDLHGQLVLLKLRDEFDAEFDFSFLPSDAKRFGQSLIAMADKIEGLPKLRKQ